ncbi:hypothetical protein [Dactylosporangium sp. NPDC051484]|uniref:hypothetical protein n=1 Tax=Dactylosporangium sp. NPDC051484 TaxID=3154942 RepID=UPI003450C796
MAAPPPGESGDRVESVTAGSGRVRSWSIFPFGAGPTGCPGRNVMLLTTSTLIAVLLNRFGPLRTPLPRTLDHTSLHLELRG